MKKTMAVLDILCLLLLSGCGGSKQFHITDAQKVTLSCADFCSGLVITDSDTIQQITDNINALRFQQEGSSGESTDWSYHLCWYGADGALLEEIFVVGDRTIQCDGYVWSASQAGIDIAFLDALF